MVDSIVPASVLNRGIGQPPATTTVTDVNTEIIPANSDRTSAIVTNVGKHDVWAACDADAIFGEGILLTRNGGSMVIDSTTFTEGPITGICAAGKSSDVTYHELEK